MYTPILLIVLACAAAAFIIGRRMVTDRSTEESPEAEIPANSSVETFAEIPPDKIPSLIDAACVDLRWQTVIDLIAYLRRISPQRVDQGMLLIWSQAYFETQQYPFAARIYMEILSASPHDPEHHANMAQIQIKLGASDKAVEYIKKALELDSGNIMYYQELANALRLNRQHEEARLMRQKALELEAEQKRE